MKSTHLKKSDQFRNEPRIRVFHVERRVTAKRAYKWTDWWNSSLIAFRFLQLQSGTQISKFSHESRIGFDRSAGLSVCRSFSVGSDTRRREERTFKILDPLSWLWKANRRAIISFISCFIFPFFCVSLLIGGSRGDDIPKNQEHNFHLSACLSSDHPSLDIHLLSESSIVYYHRRTRGYFRYFRGGTFCWTQNGVGLKTSGG